MNTSLRVTACALASLLGASDALKIGMISDMHINLHYDPSVAIDESGDGHCTRGRGIPSTIHAPMGRYGCDSPAALVESMLQGFLAKEGKQDVIFFTGNFAAHHVVKIDKNGHESKETQEMMLDTLNAMTQLFAHYFPDTLVLPSFGNTDIASIDKPVADEEHNRFHQKIFDLWFETLPGNVDNLKKSQVDSIRDSFDQGGYYRVDLTDKISLLSINTLYYTSKRTH